MIQDVAFAISRVYPKWWNGKTVHFHNSITDIAANSNICYRRTASKLLTLGELKICNKKILEKGKCSPFVPESTLTANKQSSGREFRRNNAFFSFLGHFAPNIALIVGFSSKNRTFSKTQTLYYVGTYSFCHKYQVH